MSITVREAEEKRRDLEREIYELVKEFEKETELQVDAISLNRAWSYKNELMGVSAAIRFNLWRLEE